MANKVYKSIVLYFYFWVCIIFPMFLYAMLYNPADSFIEFAKSNNWSKESISQIQNIVYYILIAVSLGISFALTRWYKKDRNASYRSYVMVFLSGVMIFSVVLLTYFPDELMASINSEIRNSDKNIVLKKYKKFFDVQEIRGARNFEDITAFERGPYYVIDKNVFLCPMLTDEEIYAYIVANKFKTVVSLLNPNSPDDQKWITREKRIMSRYHIKFVNIPLANTAKSTEIKQVIDSVLKMERPCMLHSFLGNSHLHNQIVEYCCYDKKTCTIDQLKANEKRYKLNKVIKARNFNDIDKFERGAYYILGNNAYLTPLLTEEELDAYVIANKFKTVVSLLDPKNKSDIKWIKQEKEYLAPYKINFLNIPIRETSSYERIESLTDTILKLPRPILVHAFFSESKQCKDILKISAIRGGK